MKHLLLSHSALLDYGIAEDLENAERLRAILVGIEASPYKQFIDLSINRLATIHELSLIHTADYIDHVLSRNDSDVKAALMAAGISLELIERLLKGKIQDGFALVRPPGHHATQSAGMGFCIFNNVAIAAKKAISMGINRILILDWDVHHGNGTQEIFFEDDRVFFIDFHQENLFPENSGLLKETGKGKGLGFTLNIPFPAFSGDADYLQAFDLVVKPLALEYRPELILISAGFDAHAQDPLGSMSLTTKGFGLLTARVKALARQVCNGKLLFFLEGGYDSFYLARNVIECLRVLTEGDES